MSIGQTMNMLLPITPLRREFTSKASNVAISVALAADVELL
jgi:hypothetical protein